MVGAVRYIGLGLTLLCGVGCKPSPVHPTQSTHEIREQFSAKVLAVLPGAMTDHGEGFQSYDGIKLMITKPAAYAQRTIMIMVAQPAPPAAWRAPDAAIRFEATPADLFERSVVFEGALHGLTVQ